MIFSVVSLFTACYVSHQECNASISINQKKGNLLNLAILNCLFLFFIFISCFYIFLLGFSFPVNSQIGPIFKGLKHLFFGILTCFTLSDRNKWLEVSTEQIVLTVLFR